MKKPCPICNGRGWVPDQPWADFKPKDCSCCLGTGEWNDLRGESVDRTPVWKVSHEDRP